MFLRRLFEKRRLAREEREQSFLADLISQTTIIKSMAPSSFNWNYDVIITKGSKRNIFNASIINVWSRRNVASIELKMTVTKSDAFAKIATLVERFT